MSRARESMASLKGAAQMVIGGRSVAALSGQTFPTLNPATGQILAQIPKGDRADVEAAVKAARKAFDEGPWPRMKPAERKGLLLRYAALIEKLPDGCVLDGEIVIATPRGLDFDALQMRLHPAASRVAKRT